jgi:hypothetical protein
MFRHICGKYSSGGKSAALPNANYKPFSLNALTCGLPPRLNYFDRNPVWQNDYWVVVQFES